MATKSRSVVSPTAIKISMLNRGESFFQITETTRVIEIVHHEKSVDNSWYPEKQRQKKADEGRKKTARRQNGDRRTKHTK